MTSHKIMSVLKVIALLFITIQAYAIDIQLQNYSISPVPINAGQMYTISFDLVNVADGSGESSAAPRVVIDNDGGFTPSQILSESSLDSITANWFNGTEVAGVLIFDLDLSASPLPPGQSIMFQADFTAGSNPVQLSAITAVASDFGLTDSSPGNNVGVANVEVVSGGSPDLDFVDSVTPAVYNSIEFQVAPVLMDFRVQNLGVDAPLGASMMIFHDEISFGLIQGLSTVPTGWNCGPTTGGTECTTNNNITSGSFTNFQLAFPSGPEGSYVFTGDLNVFSASDSNPGNNGITTNLNIIAAVPDLDMNIVTPNTFPVHVDQGSTTPTPFTFRVSNIGNTVFQAGDVEVFIGHDPLFTIANVQTTAFGWSCNPDTGGFKCFNTSVLVLPLDQIDISGEITSYPTTIMDYPSTVYAIVTDLTGAEASAGLDVNNDFDITVGIVPLETDLRLSKFAKDVNGTQINESPVGDSYFYHIHIDNNSTTAANNVDVSDLLPAGVQFVMDVSLGNWSCIADPFINDTSPQGVMCSHPGIPASSPNFNEWPILEVKGLTIGSKSNTALVFSDENDSNPLDNDNILTPSVINIVAAASNPDVIITKTFLSGVVNGKAGATAEQNSQIIYKVLAKNNTDGAVNAENVFITDVLPNNVSFAGFGNNVGPNFAGTCTFDSNAGVNGTVSCGPASLPFTTGDDGVEIIVNVTGSIGQTVDNTATVTSSNDINTGNNSSSTGPFTIVTGLLEVDLVISKDATNLSGASASSFNVGESFNYELVVSNSGSETVPISDVNLFDQMPIGVDLDAIPTGAGWDCSASDLANSIVDCFNTIALTTATSLNLTIPVSSQIPANYINQAFVGLHPKSSVVESILSNNDSTIAVDIISQGIPNVDIDMTKIAQDLKNNTITSVTQGDTFNYKLFIANSGDSTAPVGSVEVQDTLPPEVSLVTPFQSPANWTCNVTGNHITCINDVPIVAAGPAHIIIIPVIAQVAAINVDNTATVGVVAPPVINDTDTGNDSGTALIDIVSTATNLLLSKTVQGGIPITGASGATNEFAIGDTVIYKLSATNNSNISYTDLVIKDTLPANVVFSNTIPNQGFVCNFNSTNREVTCMNDTNTPFGAGQIVDIDIETTAMVSGLGVVNIANATSVANNDVVSSNAAIIDIVSNVMNTSLSVSKDTFVNATQVTSISKGTAFTYKIKITNTGTEDAINLTLVDNMPQGVVVNGSVGTGWTCSNVMQQYTCQFSGVLLSGDSTFVDFDVQDGSAANVIQLQNTVDVTADNATLVSAVNTVNLTGVSLNLNVTQNPTSITENAAFELIIDVVNTGTEAIQGAQIVNTLPTGFSYLQNLSNGCTANGLVVTCNVSVAIAVGATESIIVPVTSIAQVDANATYTNMTTVTGTNVSSSVSANTTINIVQSGILAYTVNINDNIDPVQVGSAFVDSVSITNTGSVPITMLTYDVNIPSELTLASFSPTSSTCTTTAFGLSCSSTNGLNIAPGTSLNVLDIIVSSAVFTGDVTVNVNAIAEGQLNASATEITTIIAATTDDSDLSISKTASLNEVQINGNYSYTLTVTNNSTSAATGIIVTDVLPTDLILNSINASNWTCNNSSSIVCNIDSIAANSSSTIDIDVTAPAQVGTVTNVAQVTGNGQDSNLANNSSQVAVIITNTTNPSSADLSILKSVAVKSVTSGEQLTWNIDVTNNGPDSASNVVVTDHLPSGFDLVSAISTDKVVCTPNNTDVVCNFSTIANGETKTIIVIGTVTLTSGMLDNSVSVSSATSDPDNKNNSDMASVIVNPVVDSNADLSANIETIRETGKGSNIIFKVQLMNNGPENAATPVVQLITTGNFNSINVNQGSQWTCQATSLVTINCLFNNLTMLNEHHSSIVVTVDPTITGNEVLTVGLAASISSTTSDSDHNNNNAVSELDIGGPPTEEEILAAMQAALAGISNQQTDRAIKNVASYCGNRYENALDGLCQTLYHAALAGEGVALNEVMEQITPNEAIGQSTSVAELAKAQFRNVGARLSELRGGGGSGFSTAGLNARYGNGSIPLGMLAYLKSDDDIELDRDFISPWGFFVNGSISMGEQDTTGRELGFDFDTFGLTAGFDYRLDAKKAIGIALGYASFESEIGETATLKSTGLTLTGYGSFYVNDNFYVDARISVAKPDFDQSRNIDFEIGDIAVHTTANGRTNANQYSFAMSAGYHFNKNAWNITPNASVSYVKTSIDGFTETGAGAFNFIFSGQEVESLVWSTGIRMSKAISLNKGVITPQFDIDYNYESLNDGIDIEARFIMAPDDEIFIIETDSPDRTYGSAGIGLVYISANGKQAYINYRSVLGLEGFSRGTFNLGARFEF